TRQRGRLDGDPARREEQRTEQDLDACNRRCAQGVHPWPRAPLPDRHAVVSTDALGCAGAEGLLEGCIEVWNARVKTRTLKIAGIIAILIGLILELFMIGADLSLGTLVAGLGIFVFVYAYFQERENRKRRR